MRKKLFYFLLITVLIFSFVLSGCKKSDKAGGPVELSVFHYIDITSPEAKVDDQIFAKFAEKYPNITLKFEKNFQEAYHQKLKALAASGNLSDVMYLWPGGRTAELTDNDLVEDLYPFLGGDKGKYVPSAVAPQGDGKLYELPIAVTATHLMYANTKLLKDIGASMPKTFAELKALVPKAKAKGIDVIIMPNKADWVMQSCLYSALLGRVAGDMWIKDAVAGKASFTDADFVKSVDVLQQIYTSGVFPPSSIQLEYGDGPNLFAQGKGLFMIDGDWRVNALIPLMDDAAQGDIELTVFPDIAGQKGTKGSTSLVPGTGLGMKAGLSKAKQQAAWKLISFYSGPEAAELRLKEQGVIPAYKMDLSKFEIAPLAKKRGAFYATHTGVPVIDNILKGEPVAILQTGLQEIGLGTTTPEAVGKKVADALKNME